MLPATQRFGRTFAPFAGLFFLFSILRGYALEAPPAIWATFITGTNIGVFAPKILANPAGGFYFYSWGERPLIKFNADNSIAWEVRYDRGVNDIREVTQLDILSNGDLIAIVSTTSNPRLFGQQFTADGTYLVELRAADGSALFVKACENCALTAVKARPGGGYFLAGYNSATPRIGTDQLNVTTPGIFLAQYTSAFDWTLTGGGSSDAYSYSINAIRTFSGATLKIYAAGTAPGGWTFSDKSVGQAGAYLLTANILGQAVDAQVIATNASFAAMETTPNGRIHFAANLGGSNLVRRIEADGSLGWIRSVANCGPIAALTPTDELFAIGGNQFAATSALDANGNLKWQRIEATRSDNTGNGVALLSDGRLIISGVARGSGIFIDDFFLNDFAQDEIALFGAFIAALETRPSAAPAFHVQPRDQKFALRGEAITLHAEVYSSTLTWFKDGVVIPNQTSEDLTIASAQPGDSGTYLVEARNAAGITRSKPAQVIVNTVTVSTVAGTDGADVFERPKNPITMPDGAILVADAAKNVIKTVDANGIRTFAGAGQAGLANGSPLEALFSAPAALAYEARYFGPIVFVADSGNNRVRRIHLSSQTGEATSVDEVFGAFGGVDSIATLDGAPFFVAGSAQSSGVWKTDANASVNLPVGLPSGIISAVAVDVRGNIYLGDRGLHQIRRITPAGDMQIVGAAGDPSGIAIDESGNLYVTERATHSILKISAAGVTTVVAGLQTSGFQNGNAFEALFNGPEGLCFRDSSLIVADTGNHCLREIKFEPAQTGVTGTATISASVGSFLRLSVAGNAGEQYAVESSAQVGPAASWQSEGTVSIGQVTSDLLLPKPSATRFYRARKIQ